MSVQHVSAARSDGTVSSYVLLTEGQNGAPDVTGGGSGAGYGLGATEIGDFDGDGVTDLAVAATYDGGTVTDAGAVFIQLMNADSTVKSYTTIASGVNGGPPLVTLDFFGSGLANLGDLDGDGNVEIAASAPGDDTGGDRRGAFYVLFLDSDGTVKSYKKIASGTNGGPTLTNVDRFGFDLTAMGDLDGNGVIDLAVSAREDAGGGTQRGAVYVMFMSSDGTAASYTKIGSGTGGGPTLADSDLFGTSVSSISDLDSDGITDLLVGASGDDTGGSSRGAAYVLFMNSDGTAASYTKIASGTGGGPTLADSDFFGYDVASVGDLNKDGLEDVAIGADGDDTGGSSRGAVYIGFMSSNGTLSSTVKLASGTNGVPALPDSGLFGKDVSSGIDLDSDGIEEVLVGGGGNGLGTLYVLHLTKLIAEQTTSNSVAMTRLAAGQSSTFGLSFTLQGTDTGALNVAFPTGFTVTGAFTAGSCSGGGDIGTFAYNSSALTGIKTGCSGTVTLTGATVTNPSTPGTYVIEWANDEGSVSVEILDSDQVTVTSTVDPTLTFDIDTGVATSANSTPTYTVAFGIVGTGDVETSGSTDGVNHIGIDLSANATGGAVVTIQNSNGTSGLVSTSVPGDTIPSATATMAAGTANYGFCVVYANAGSGTLQVDSGSPYNGLTCASDSNTNQVAALSTAPQTFLNTAGAASDAGRAVLVGNAAASSSTGAHDDYTDTLTFIATGTF